MAKCESHLHTIMRGSIAGITYTANQWCAIIARARVAPVNPCTAYQTMIRSAFAGAQGLWLGLTDALRTAWNDYAQTCIYPGPLGPYKVPGRWMFSACTGWANYLILRGIATVTGGVTPPTIPGWLPIDSIGEVAYIGPGTGFSIGFTSNNTEDVTVLVERSFAFNPTRYRFKGPFLPATLEGTEIVGPGGSAFIEFDGLTAGMAYFVRLRAITSDAPHRISGEYIVRAIATTVP